MSAQTASQQIQANNSNAHEFSRKEIKSSVDLQEVGDALRKSEMYMVIMNRIEHHIKMCNQQIARYGRWALRTRFLLPLLSATATGLATVAAGAHSRNADWELWIAWAVAIASFIATVVSALNSAVRPSLQYAHYVRFINRFWHVKVAIGFDVEDVLMHACSLAEAEQDFHKRLLQRNEEVEDIIVNFSDASATNIGLPKPAQGNNGSHLVEPGPDLPGHQLA